MIAGTTSLPSTPTRCSARMVARNASEERVSFRIDTDSLANSSCEEFWQGFEVSWETRARIRIHAVVVDGEIALGKRRGGWQLRMRLAEHPAEDKQSAPHTTF